MLDWILVAGLARVPPPQLWRRAAEAREGGLLVAGY
jgi:hypothetical protein